MTESLEFEIEKARVKVSADSLTMTVSELTNLYREGVLTIRPEFQRLFRWTDEQKSRLVESIMLGIPLPSIFVAQIEDGTWELVDGLQRVSTLLELQGLLEGADGGRKPAFHLQATKFLPALEGHSWDGNGDSTALADAQKLDLRLSRLDIRVIKRSSDPKTKFDLFQRLNSFGSVLTPQEVRSAMMAGVDSSSLAWLTKLAQDQNFTACVSLSERLNEEQYDLELVLRFLMLHSIDTPSRRELADFTSKLDDWAVDLAADFEQRRPALEDVFVQTFKILATSGGEDLFRKWDSASQRYRGAFLNTAFEIIAIGAGYLVAKGMPVRNDVTNASRELSAALDEASRFATGLATADRLVKVLPMGRGLMSEPPQRIVF